MFVLNNEPASRVIMSASWTDELRKDMLKSNPKKNFDQSDHNAKDKSWGWEKNINVLQVGRSTFPYLVFFCEDSKISKIN